MPGHGGFLAKRARLLANAAVKNQTRLGSARIAPEPVPNAGQKGAGQMRDHSLLVVGFGQSNADIHDAGPRIAAPALDDPRLVVPNDGGGFRGAPVRPIDRITGFAPFAGHERKAMSLLGAVGARVLHDMGQDAPGRVIIRSAAKGGRRFQPTAQNDQPVEGILFGPGGGLSEHFERFLMTIARICEVAATDGRPVAAICPVFVHGESDRSLPRAVYRDLTETMLDWTEHVLAPLRIPVQWFAVQAAGTGQGGNGNAWPNRDAIRDLAASRSDLTLAAAAYPYALHDRIHFSATGKALLGETVGRAMAGWLRGQEPALPRLRRILPEGDRLRLEFDSDAPLVIDPAPACGHHGFSLDQGRIRGVWARGREVVLELDQPAERVAGIAYAWASEAQSPDARPDHPVGGGALRTARAAPSILVPGETLHDWVPGFAL